MTASVRNCADIPPFPIASPRPARSFTIVTQDFTNLPPLIPQEADLVGAMISSPNAIPDIAEALDLRAGLRLAEAARRAVDTLERIAESLTPTTHPADASETRRNSTNRRDAKAAPSSGNPAHKISSEPQLARPP